MVTIRRIGFLLLLLVPCLAWAQVMPVIPPVPPVLPLPPTPIINDPSILTAAYQSMVGQWFSAVSPYAFELFYALAGLDIAVFGWNLWMQYNGDIRTAMMSTANKILILGFFLDLLLNGQNWMSAIIQMFITMGKAASGLPGLGPSVLLLQGFKIFGTLLWQAAKSSLFLDFPTAIALIIGAGVICLAFLVITCQFIITQVQMFLAVGMGYFFLAFGGSRWTTNYVERYFAFSVATGTKMMVLYMLAGAAWPITNNWITSATKVTLTAASVEECWLIGCGAVIYAVIVWFVSSLVSQVFGGSPNLSHSDFIHFMGPAISAAVTAGMVAAGVATAGAGAAAGAGVAGAGAAVTASTGSASAAGVTAAQPAAQAAASNGIGRAAGSLVQAGANAVRQAPHGGQSGPPPSFNGFGH